MIVNEKISKIKLELLKEEFIKQIKDSYTLNLSMVLLEEFENLQQENTQLKDKIEKAFKIVDDKLRNINLEYGVDNEFREEYDELWEILK